MTQTRGQVGAPDRRSVRPVPGVKGVPGVRSGPRLEPRSSVRLTGRGALAAMFVLCFFTQLIADWTGWGTLAGAAFVCGCGVITYYTRTSGLRSVVVAPPLMFFAGSACAELITAPGTFLAAEGILVTLGTTAPWLYTATALTVVVAVGRGYRPAFRWLARPAAPLRGASFSRGPARYSARYQDGPARDGSAGDGSASERPGGR
jgi:hypothetical protein